MYPCAVIAYLPSSNLNKYAVAVRSVALDKSIPAIHSLPLVSFKNSSLLTARDFNFSISPSKNIFSDSFCQRLHLLVKYSLIFP